MTLAGDVTIELIPDALEKAWWVPNGTDDLEGLRRAALWVFAGALTPARRFVLLLGEGAFGEAEGLLDNLGDTSGGLGELSDAGKRLVNAREAAVRRTSTNLEILRRRSARLGRNWDDDLAALLISTAEEDERDVLAELRSLAASISVAEDEAAEMLMAASRDIDETQADRLRDLVVEKQWDAARQLVAHGEVDSAVSDTPTTPALARLGVSPPALLRSFAKGHNPGRRSDGWRHVDQQLTDVIARISMTGLGPALAEALRCTATIEGATTSLHEVFSGARAKTVGITTVHLHSTPGADELSVTFEGLDMTGSLDLERTLQVLLSPGDRSWQLLRAIVHDWSVTEILSLTLSAASVLDRIEAVLDLALRSPQAATAALIAHRAGFNLALAEPLLGVAVPVAIREGRLSSDALDTAMLESDLVPEWHRIFTDFALHHPDAFLLLAEATSNNEAIVDADLASLLADLAGVQSLDTAIKDLEAVGFAARYDDGETIFHIEPLRIVRHSGLAVVHKSANPL